MQHGHVFGAKILAAAHPVLNRWPAIVDPGLVQLQRRAADMHHERSVRFDQPLPERIELDVAGRAAAARMMRHPDGLGATLQCELEFLKRESGLVQRRDRDAHQARVVRTKIRHVTVGVHALHRSAASARFSSSVRRHRHAMRREHELFLKPSRSMAFERSRPSKAPNA